MADDWRLARGLEKLRAQINALAPNRKKTSDGTRASPEHSKQNPTSDHEPDPEDGVVKALDITIDKAAGVTHDIAEQIRSDPRIKYVISNRRISNPSIEGGKWRPYKGKNPHELHFHVSILKPYQDEAEDWQFKLSPPSEEVEVSRPLLIKGSKGPAVKELQILLGLDPDEVFGGNTENAVMDFQHRNGLVVDGEVGADTWEALIAAGPQKPLIPLFEQKVPALMMKLMRDFPEMEDFQAAGVWGNAGHECAGFTLWQEAGKVPPKGGWGWFQWTATRRDDFNEWIAKKGFDAKSDEANYGFLVEELRGPEKKALEALLETKTLEGATEVFMTKFERPGVPHLDRRIGYAKRAMVAFKPTEPTEPQEPEGPQFPDIFPPWGGGQEHPPPLEIPTAQFRLPPTGNLLNVMRYGMELMNEIKKFDPGAMTIEEYLRRAVLFFRTSEPVRLMQNVISPPALPSKPEPTTEGKKEMFGANWRTSLAGIGVVLSALATGATALSKGNLNSETIGLLLSAIMGLFGGGGLLAAKDKVVTGGTVANDQRNARVEK